MFGNEHCLHRNKQQKRCKHLLCILVMQVNNGVLSFFIYRFAVCFFRNANLNLVPVIYRRNNVFRHECMAKFIEFPICKYRTNRISAHKS